MKKLSRGTTLVRSPWTDSFRALLSATQRDLLLVSPFIKVQTADEVVANLQLRDSQTRIHVKVLTNLRPESILNGATDLEALTSLGRSIQSFELVHLPSLHAKVYVADSRIAVVTSANLTQSGISKNLEYGVALTDPFVVNEVRRDFEGYAQLGAKIEFSDLKILAEQSRDLRDAFVKAERTIRTTAKRALAAKFASLKISLLRQRAKGKTTHSILAETILYLLAKGPLQTTEIHRLIQQIHPDICSNSIDRVIDGVHFGKRWKHEVRTSQAFLRRKGLIYRHERSWHLAEAPSFH